MRKGLSEETLLKLLVTSYGNGQYATMLPDLLRLALLTGARLSDLCDLKLADVPFFQLTEKFSKSHTGWLATQC
jgi:integrase